MTGHDDVGSSYEQLVQFLQGVMAYEQQSAGVIRLVPTEGLMSPLQKLMQLTVQAERYLHAPPEFLEKAALYPDIGGLQKAYGTCRTLVEKALHANWCLPDFLSGLQVMTAAVLAYSQPSELVLSIAPRNGGHDGTRAIVERLRRRSVYLEFDSREHVLNPINLGLPEVALVYLDHSNCLYAHDLRALRASFPEAVIVADISQVLGLVVTGAFQNPLDAGADVVTASTHKSLSGPQKAILATNDEHLSQVAATIAREMVSNNHPADVAALAVCLLELQLEGGNYGQRLVDNARTLAATLQQRGCAVYAGTRPVDRLTDTQHVWLDSEKFGVSAIAGVRLLMEAGLIANTLPLARGGPNDRGALGVRMGTTEATRLGMGPQEMILIGRWIADLLQGQASTDSIHPQVAELRSRYPAPPCAFPLADLPNALRADLRQLLAGYATLLD